MLECGEKVDAYAETGGCLAQWSRQVKPGPAIESTSSLTVAEARSNLAPTLN